MSRFEIVVPCYKYGPFLRECVSSVLSQSVRDLRVVIVDDASPDNTGTVAAELALEDSRVSVITHAENKGHIATYNEAFALAEGEYSLLLSADDLLTPGSLERASRALDSHPAAALCFGNDIAFTTDRPKASPRGETGVTWESYDTFVENACRQGHTPIQAPTAVMRTAAQRRLGGFLPSLPHTADTEIWLRLAAEGGVVKVEADQAYRRLHASNMSLNYSPARRLREQQAAFLTHFEWMGLRLHARPALEQILSEHLGTAAFWTAARAFDDGDRRTLEESLQYCLDVWPAIRRQPQFRRLKIKRLLGLRVWSLMESWMGHRRESNQPQVAGSGHLSP